MEILNSKCSVENLPTRLGVGPAVVRKVILNPRAFLQAPASPPLLSSTRRRGGLRAKAMGLAIPDGRTGVKNLGGEVKLSFADQMLRGVYHRAKRSQTLI